MVKVHCDNKGVLCHGRRDEMRLKENQSQADALVRMKKLTKENTVGTYYVWVKAHVKQERGKRKSIGHEHNDVVDEISLQIGLRTDQFASTELPLEDVWLTLDGAKITGSIGKNLREHWARAFAKRYFAEKCIVREENF